MHARVIFSECTVLIYHVIILLIFLITYLLGMSITGYQLIIQLGWWNLFFVILYVASLILTGPLTEIFASIVKVYSIYATLTYWAGVFPVHKSEMDNMDWYFTAILYVIVPLAILVTFLNFQS